jgi:hypothetical protein
LDNNYKAWLYEEKKVHQLNLLTEYEIVAGPEHGKMSIVDKILDGIQINLGRIDRVVSTTIRYYGGYRCHDLPFHRIIPLSLNQVFTSIEQKKMEQVLTLLDQK